MLDSIMDMDVINKKWVNCREEIENAMHELYPMNWFCGSSEIRGLEYFKKRPLYFRVKCKDKNDVFFLDRQSSWTDVAISRMEGICENAAEKYGFKYEGTQSSQIAELEFIFEVGE